MASLNSARGKARDARRISDLKQIQIALEFYYDTNNVYPAAYYGVGVCNGALNQHNDSWCRDTRFSDGAEQIQNWIPGSETYLSSMPHNPKPYYSGHSYPYHYLSDGQRYWMMVALEKSAPCNGATYTFFDGQNGCALWGSSTYIVKNF